MSGSGGGGGCVAPAGGWGLIRRVPKPRRAAPGNHGGSHTVGSAGFHPRSLESDLNRNTLKGAVADAVGRIQRTLGRLMGSPKQEVKGAAKQAVGKTQKAVGKAQAAVGKGKSKAKRKAKKAGA